MRQGTDSVRLLTKLELAVDLERRARARWGTAQPTVMVGRHPSMREVLDRARRFADSDSPVMITGETGSGKELIARALFLFSLRKRRPFVVVNCAQYGGGQPIVSELFGHQKGSFTGAATNHRGIFEAADTGCAFLDEVGELPLSVQSMLLRMLAEGELIPVGGVKRKRVNVRIVAASNRDLQQMVRDGGFREDLFYRLQTLFIHVPPLRERGDDWRLIASYYLDRLNLQADRQKRFAPCALERLSAHDWPGNVRELKSVIESGYYVSRADSIRLSHIEDRLEGAGQENPVELLLQEQAEDLAHRMAGGEGDFWQTVYRPYMDRNLNRREVQAVITHALEGAAAGSYKRMLLAFGVEEVDYLKAMDFLRHHRLKPPRAKRDAAAARSKGQVDREVEVREFGRARIGRQQYP